MSAKRFFIEKQNFKNNKITINGAEHNHLKNVLRLKVGNTIIVVCGDEFDYFCEIKSIDRTETIAKIIKTEKNQFNSDNKITVFQALIKKDKMSLVVQKLTELGVAEFTPIETKFITAKDKFNTPEKLQTISNQSIKQCKRSKPMLVNNTKKFNEFINKLKEFDVVIFANETEQSKNLSNISLDINQKIAIIVGSEGGFDLDEINEILGVGATSVSLGSRILRAETATIALSSIVMHKIGEI